MEILHFEANYRLFLIEMSHGGRLLKNEEEFTIPLDNVCMVTS
jgi:hypothetical protein